MNTVEKGTAFQNIHHNILKTTAIFYGKTFKNMFSLIIKMELKTSHTVYGKGFRNIFSSHTRDIYTSKPSHKTQGSVLMKHQ